MPKSKFGKTSVEKNKKFFDFIVEEDKNSINKSNTSKMKEMIDSPREKILTA
jgi:hypothetical protein